MAPKVKPLAYSPLLPLILAKAVEKIRFVVYFSPKELLADNIALMEQLPELGQSFAVHAPQSSFKLRSITDPSHLGFLLPGLHHSITDHSHLGFLLPGLHGHSHELHGDTEYRCICLDHHTAVSKAFSEWLDGL